MFYGNVAIGVLSHIQQDTVIHAYFVDIALKITRIKNIIDNYNPFTRSNSCKQVKYDDDRFVRFTPDLNF